MTIDRFTVPCTVCGKDVEREKRYSNAVCFQCKNERKKKAYEKRKDVRLR